MLRPVQPHLYGAFADAVPGGNLRDGIHVPVPAEKDHLIVRGQGSEKCVQKLSQLPAKRMGAYLRKMAIDGYIINLDTADIKAFTGELAAIGRNINQIAKRVNAGDSLYQADIQEIRERLDEIWQLQRRILLKNDGTFNYSGARPIQDVPV